MDGWMGSIFHLAKTALAEDHEEIEISGTNDVLSAHVVRNFSFESRRLFRFGNTDDGRLLADLFAEDFRVDAIGDGHIVELAFLFREQLEPTLNW